jgi:MFS family permease
MAPGFVMITVMRAREQGADVGGGTAKRPPANRLTALRFVVAFGVVSALGDVVYESARSIIGPYLAGFGASAFVVGVVTGIGEAVALVFRLFSGRLADRTQRPWPQTIVGYTLTMVCVPLIALANGLAVSSLLYNGERFGKAVRAPSRDIMLAHAAAGLGPGRGRGAAFGLHEALDQCGALLGPLGIAGFLALGGSLRGAFAVLAAPAVLALVVLARLRISVPAPERFDPETETRRAKDLTVDARLPRQFWLYAAFAAGTMLGFATWAVLAFHLAHQHVLSASRIAVLYAVAMGAAAISALGFGRIYDRIGLRGLVVLPPLAAAVPWLSFRSSVVAVSVGAVLWGLAMGAHESTMRAAVADLVPAHRRGAGYGTFTAIYGLAWLGGAALIGFLYEHGVATVGWFTVAVQVVATGLLLRVLRDRPA